MDQLRQRWEGLSQRTLGQHSQLSLTVTERLKKSLSTEERFILNLSLRPPAVMVAFGVLTPTVRTHHQ